MDKLSFEKYFSMAKAKLGEIEAYIRGSKKNLKK
jgi:hypothetical protein